MQTFEEWWADSGFASRDGVYCAAKAAWQAAHENSAQICELHGSRPQVITYMHWDDLLPMDFARGCAAAIRARSDD